MQQKEPVSSISIDLRFTEVEQLFWILHGWRDEDCARFQSSMKQFRRNGIPIASLSRGPASQYDLDAVFQLALVQLLSDQQTPINVACALVRSFWSSVLEPAVLRAWDMLRRGDERALLALIFQTSFEGWSVSRTQEAWDWVGEDFDAAENWNVHQQILVDTVDSPRLADFFSPKVTEPLGFGLHHASVINLSKLVHGVTEVLVRLDFAERAQIERWFNERLATQEPDRSMGEAE